MQLLPQRQTLLLQSLDDLLLAFSLATTLLDFLLILNLVLNVQLDVFLLFFGELFKLALQLPASILELGVKLFHLPVLFEVVLQFQVFLAEPFTGSRKLYFKFLHTRGIAV